MQYDEDLVGVVVLVSDEFTLELDQFEMIIVHLGDDLWRPVFRKRPIFLRS